MDAFAVAICIGLSYARVHVKTAVIVGLYFATFQAIMPLIGYMIAILFADMIIMVDHWIAFGLLCFLGAKMIVSSFKKEREPFKQFTLVPSRMLPLAVATSIDALAIGISFAFLHVNVVSAVLLIGSITFVISIMGVKIGSIFGGRFKSKAELVGGVILVLIGLKILLSHLEIISF